jgi:thiamine monophosphate synthase
MSEDLNLFADEQVELLPERTTMQAGFFQNGNLSIAVAVNAGNINFGGSQLNAAVAAALAGSNVGIG